MFWRADAIVVAVEAEDHRRGDRPNAPARTSTRCSRARRRWQRASSGSTRGLGVRHADQLNRDSLAADLERLELVLVEQQRVRRGVR
jgi:hypothetical protein